MLGYVGPDRRSFRPPPLGYGWRKPLLKGLDRGPAHFRIMAAMARQVPVARVVRPAAGPLRLDALADRIEAHLRETVPGRA